MTEPRLECRTEGCTAVLAAEHGLKGCPVCGGPVRWVNYVEMFGAAAHTKNHLGNTPPKIIAGS